MNSVVESRARIKSVHVPTALPWYGSYRAENQFLVMKVSKTLLQTIALAVAVTTVTACDKDDVKPKKKNKSERQQPYNCPACGMG